MTTAAALAINTANVQAAYIAYFGRPADPAGLNFWLTAGTEQTTMLSIMRDFANSAEFSALYGGKTGAAFVNAVYQNVFGHDADAGGLNFYVNALVAGAVTYGDVVYNIISGATGTDKTIVDNKIAYATEFTSTLAADIGAYINYTADFGQPLARTQLATITASSTSLTDALGNLAATMQAIAAGPQASGPTFDLAANVASVDEGGTVVFTLSTKGVAAGAEYSYVIGGVSASDVVGGAVTGKVSLDAFGKAVVAVTLAADAITEGAETLTLTLAGKTASVVVADTSTAPAATTPTYTLSALNPTVAEGGLATFLLQTTNVAAGTQIGYKIVGTGSAAGQSATGLFTVDSTGLAAVTALPASNATIGDTGSLTIELLSGLTGAATITVADATATTYGINEITAANAGSGLLSINVAGTAAQTITLETAQVSATRGFLVTSLTAPVTVNSGAGSDTITVIGNADNAVNGGAGNDTIVMSGIGNNTVNIGAGNDSVTLGDGNDSVIVGSGALNGFDVIDTGDGDDTVTVSGVGNVVTTANLVNVENLVLQGTQVTFSSAAAAAGLKSISGGAATSEVTVNVTNGDVVDLTAIDLVTLKSLTINNTAGAATITLKADAADLLALGAVLRSGGTLPTVNLETNVEGYKAYSATADTGITGTKTVTDTVDALIANQTSLAGATLVVSGIITADDVMRLADAGITANRTVSMTVADLLVAALYPDQLAALKAAGSQIQVVGDATVAQANSLIAAYGAEITAYQAAKVGNKGIVIVDTPANVAAAAAALNTATQVSSVTLAAGAALTVAQAASLQAVVAKIAAGTYTVTDTAAIVAANKAAAGVTGAASVSLTDGARTANSVAAALDLKSLGAKLVGGYDLAETTTNGLTVNGLSALAGATAATLTGTVSVTQLAQLQASNPAVKVTVVSDNAANLVAATGKLSAVTTDLIVEGDATVAQAKEIKVALDAILAKTGGHSAPSTAGANHTNEYYIVDTASNVVAVADAAIVKGAKDVVVSNAMTLADATTLRALATASAADALATAGLHYSVTDSAANLAAALGATSNQTAVDVLAAAGTVTANTTATVSQAKVLGAGYTPTGGGAAVQVDSYTITDTVAKLFTTATGSTLATDIDNIADTALAKATKLSVTGDLTLAQLASLKTVANAASTLIFDSVYALSDTIANLASSPAADVTGATSVTATDTASVANLAGIVALNAALTTAGKPTLSYTLTDTYTNVTGASALGSGVAATVAAAKAATLITVNGNFTAPDPNKIDANALLDLSTKAGTTLYTVVVTDVAANIATQPAGVLGSGAISKIVTSDAQTVAGAKTLLTAVGASVASKVQYDLSDAIDSLIATADAFTVLAARNLTATDATTTVAKAATLLSLTGAAGTVSYNIGDTYAKVAANAAVADGATSINVTDTALTVAQYTNLLALAGATSTVATTVAQEAVVDTSAAVAGASTAVLTALSTVTLTDIGSLTLSVAQARALESGGAYKLAAAAGQPGGVAVNVKIVDTTANLLALIDEAGSPERTALLASYSLTASDTATLTVANAQKLVTAGVVATYAVSDLAAAVKVGGPVVTNAQTVAVTDSASAADALTIYTANNSVTFAKVVDTAAELGKQTVLGTYDYALTLAKATAIETSAAASVADVTKALAAAGAVSVKYSLVDTATALAGAAAATRTGATAITVSTDAKASEADELAAVATKIGAGFNVTDTAANLAAAAVSDLAKATVVTATTAATVAQYQALKPTLGAKLAATAVTDSAAAIATFLAAGGSAGVSGYSFTSNVTVNATQAQAIATASVATATLKVVDTAANLLTLADAFNATSFTATGTVDLATAKQLVINFEAKAAYAVATTADRFVAAYADTTVTDNADAFNLKDVLKQATTVTVDGVSIVLGAKNATLESYALKPYASKVVGTVAEIDALPAALKDAAGYVVVDSLANITAASNVATLVASSGYIVKDTAANVKAAAASVLASVSGALGIDVTDAASVADVAAILALTNVDAYVTYSLTDTVANLKAGGAIVSAASAVTATGSANVADANAILVLKTTAVVDVVDTAVNLTGSADLGKYHSIVADNNLSTAGLQGIAVADAVALIAGKAASATLTMNISDSVTNVAAAAATTLAAAGTVSVTGTADAAQAKKLAAVPNLTGGFNAQDTASNLTDTAIVAVADLAKATTVKVTTAATVAQANTLMGLANLEKGAANTADATKYVLSITDTAKALAGADATKLDSIASANTVTVSSYALALTAAEATALAAVDAASTKLSITAASVKVSDESANLLAAANATALAAVGSIDVKDAVSVATLAAVKAVGGTGAGEVYTYKLADSAANLIVAGGATVGNASTVKVTGSISVQDLNLVKAAAAAGTVVTTVKYDLVVDTAANLFSGAVLNADVAADATVINLSGSAEVAQVKALKADSNFAGGYSVADSGAALAAAINGNDKALLDGATTVSIKAGTFANVSEAKLISTQLTNEAKLAVSDVIANLSAAAAATVVADAASVRVEAGATNDALSASATTAKVTYYFDSLGDMSVLGNAAVDVLSLKSGDVLNLSGIVDFDLGAGIQGYLTLNADANLLAGEYQTTRGYYAADGSFLASANGTDLLIEIGTDATPGADEVIVLVGTTSVTTVTNGTAGQVVGFGG